MYAYLFETVFFSSKSLNNCSNNFSNIKSNEPTNKLMQLSRFQLQIWITIYTSRFKWPWYSTDLERGIKENHNHIDVYQKSKNVDSSVAKEHFTS